MQSDTNNTARLERLERQNRRLQTAAALLGLGFFGLLAAGFAHPAPQAQKEVRAERIVLVNPAGAELGVLGVDSDEFPNLLLRKGKSTAILTLNGPGLSLRADDAKRGAWLGVDTHGSVGLSLTGEKTLDGLRAMIKADGSSGAYLLDANGRERVGMELLQNGTAALSARDGEGIPRVFAGITGESQPSVVLLDDKGAKRAGFLLGPTGLPLLSFIDARGHNRLELNQGADGATKLRTFSETGQPAFETP